MRDGLRVGTLIFGISVVLGSALLGTGAAGAESLEAMTKSCSVAGLHYSEKQEGVTYGVSVANLKAKVATCPQARSLAATVAKDILHETKVPTHIAGLKVTVKEPCASCTPNTQVIANSGQKRITFTVRGGV
jgi:hypothetical protein